MRTADDIRSFEDAWLAPWAMRTHASRGRKYDEPPHEFRSLFVRDRDRIIHSSAFRRLEYKTQVFVNHEGDYYRTRLTHTMEAAQVTRTIAGAMRLNDALAEAVALAHDLGHTPFGHAGERALNRLMEPWGGFEHNAQSLRIVEELEERYPDFRGLNLTWEVREGIVKHSTRYDRPQVVAFDPELAPTLEAQIVDYADEIAYNAHDIDDGLQSELLTIEDLGEVRLWNEAFAAVREKHPRADDRILHYQAVRRIINHCVTNLIVSTERKIADLGIKSLDDVRAVKPKLVTYDDETQGKVDELKNVLFERLYHHTRVLRMSTKAERIIKGLFEVYMDEPRQMPPGVARKIDDGSPRATVVADYVAGMTDRFALEEFRKLFDPWERV